jgi:transposase
MPQLGGFMGGIIIMTEKDLEKIKVMQQLLEKQITQEQAAKVLSISDRQVRNIFKRYKELGDQGVISKKIGRASNNHLSEDLKRQALKIIVATYSDFGPTLAQEKLKENHGITISVESVRQLMITRNLWIPKGAPDPVVHRLRPRRPFFGELMQADGSKHRWFEDRGPECTLLVLIDDATSSTARLLFVPTETLEGYFELVKGFFIETGLPLAIYTDRFAVFEVMRKNPLLEEPALTQFERALRELDIKLIKAKSPQAKGRVERVNRTFQDRLVKELRLQGISDIASANTFLAGGEYLKKHNAKFAIPAPKNGTVIRALKESQLAALDRILSRNYKRTVQNDLSFQYEGEIYQIYSVVLNSLRGCKITVWKDASNKIYAELNGKNLEIHSMKENEYFAPKFTNEELMRTWKTKKVNRPNKNHPYKISYKLKNAG